jgi:ankyrin repeat protein
MRAARSGRLDEVRSLLSAGAGVNEKGFIGHTALTFAAGAGHLEIVKALLDAGADPNAAGGMGHPRVTISVLTAAMNRQNKNRMEVLDTLIAAGAKVNPPRSFPESPLDVAVRKGDLEMMSALLERGADVNWENEIGATPLVTALTDGSGPDVGAVRLLLKAGANPNRPRLWVGNDCVSLLGYLDGWLKASRDKSREEVGRLLRRYGAKTYRAKSHGKPCKP